MKLAQLRVTREEAAAYFGCDVRTIDRYLAESEFRAAWERGRLLGKIALRQLQWRHARGQGSAAVQMIIHLSKHNLGESNKRLTEIGRLGGEAITMESVQRVDSTPHLWRKTARLKRQQ